MITQFIGCVIISLLMICTDTTIPFRAFALRLRTTPPVVRSLSVARTFG
jgi:hypothetical protein